MTRSHDIWRYLRGGKVRHALSRIGMHVAECGFSPQWFEDWYGTGNQEEYDKLAELPACKRCVARGYVP